VTIIIHLRESSENIRTRFGTRKLRYCDRIPGKEEIILLYKAPIPLRGSTDGWVTEEIYRGVK
jgi:hypothetical protein